MVQPPPPPSGPQSWGPPPWENDPGANPPPYQQPPYQQPPYQQPAYQQIQYQQPQYQQGAGYPGMPSGGDYYSQFAPKPGCVPLRPLNLSDILDGSFRVIRRNPRATLLLSAIVALMQATVLALVQIFAFGQVSSGFDNTDPNGVQVNVGQVAGGEGTALLGALLGALFVAVLAGMLTLVITEDVLGNKLTISEVWTRIRPRLFRLVMLSIVVSIVPSLGLILCFAPGIWLWGIWAVAVPALVVEDARVRQALGRSRALVRGMFWRVFGIRLLGFVIAAFVGFFVQIPFVLIAGAVSGFTPFDVDTSTGPTSLPASYVLIAAIGTFLSTTLTSPIRAGIDALLYVDLRMRKEGLDIVLQQRVAGMTGGALAAVPPIQYQPQYQAQYQQPQYQPPQYQPPQYQPPQYEPPQQYQPQYQPPQYQGPVPGVPSPKPAPASPYGQDPSEPGYEYGRWDGKER